MPDRVISVQSFHHKQNVSQVLEHAFLILNVSGLMRLTIRNVDGTILVHRDDPGPYLALIVPGMTLSVEYASNRENWVAIFDVDGISYDSQSRGYTVKNRDQVFTMPMIRYLKSAECRSWQAEFANIRFTLHEPLPINQFKAMLSILNAMAFMASSTMMKSGSPEQQLKNALDADANCSKTIEELSGDCGFSSDYLRLRFQSRYRISPNGYRTQQRMNRVLSLIQTTELSVDEIAETVGFSYTSHLIKQFKSNFGITPGKAIRSYRTQ